MYGHRLWGFGIVALALIAASTFADAVLGQWTDELFRGIGIEAIGALITAIGIIGLEKLYAEPDPEIKALREQVEKLNIKLDELQKRNEA